MDTRDMVFRSISLNRDVDEAIKALAARLASPAGVIFRLFFDLGLAQLQLGVPLPAAVHEAALPLRPVHIRYGVDERLRVLAYHLKLPRDDLGARLLRLGMQTMAATGMPSGERAGGEEPVRNFVCEA